MRKYFQIVGVASLAVFGGPLGCFAETPTDREGQGFTQSKLLGPLPMVSATASSETTEELGIVRWDLYQGARGVVLTGRDAKGRPVKGLAAGFRGTPDEGAELVARVNDGSKVSGVHAFKSGSTSAAKGSMLTRLATEDMTRMNAVLATRATPRAQCGESLSAIVLAAMKCVDSGKSEGMCLASAQAAARAGALCDGAAPVDTALAKSAKSAKKKKPTSTKKKTPAAPAQKGGSGGSGGSGWTDEIWFEEEIIDIGPTTMVRGTDGRLTVSVPGTQGGGFTTLDYDYRCASGTICSLYTSPSTTSASATVTGTAKGSAGASLTTGSGLASAGSTTAKDGAIIGSKTPSSGPGATQAATSATAGATAGAVESGETNGKSSPNSTSTKTKLADVSVPLTGDNVDGGNPFQTAAVVGSIPDGASDIAADTSTGAPTVVASASETSSDNSGNDGDGNDTGSTSEIAAFLPTLSKASDE